MQYYAVARGRNPGVYTNWNACKPNVDGFSGATFRKFNTLAEAEQFVSSVSNSGSNFGNHHNSTTSSGGVSKPTSTPLRDLLEEPSDHQIYVDGAARGNGKDEIPLLGYGVYFGPGDRRNAAIPLSQVDDVHKIRPTNQRAELHAVLHALRIVRQYTKHDLFPDLYEIFTDSSYAKNAIELWSKKWMKNGWLNSHGQEVANRDLIQECAEWCEIINGPYRNVWLTHVPGHQGIAGNEAADKLANLGADRMWSKETFY